MFAAERPLQEKPSAAVSGVLGAAAPDYDKRFQQRLTASEASVRGSKLSAGKAKRSGKRDFGGFRNQQCIKKTTPPGTRRR